MVKIGSDLHKYHAAMLRYGFHFDNASEINSLVGRFGNSYMSRIALFIPKSLL
ncbi:MAG TPA: hypothetical protein VJR94_02235 [Candidatus Nitrosocosmicus sp.]|nr:hypothetical protein [Candidatus Nitrosocosmicus sp.]